MKFELMKKIEVLPDSMTLDSGTEICRLTDEEGNIVTLEVRGYVSVRYGEETYRHASDMPEELLEKFRTGEAYEDFSVVIHEGNWYEIFFTPVDYRYSEAYDVCEWEGTPAEDLEKMCTEYLEGSKRGWFVC